MDRRISELIARLTLSEKIAMLHQHSPAVPRLGLRAFRTGTEALHGLAWLGEATVFPQAVGLGATWHPELLERVGQVVGTEVRARHAVDPEVSLNVWAPVVNLLRDPRWGRNEEGYSEDALLTSRLAIAYCRGLRGSDPDFVRTAPTLKHFHAYNNEDERAATSSVLRARVLHEYELPAFAGPIQAGVVDGVMPSYNLVNGRPAHLSPYLNDLLRTWTETDLLVVSDAEAPANLVEPQRYLSDHVVAHAAALRAGVDSFTEHGDDPSFTIAQFTQALDRGLIAEADIDRAVGRVLGLRARTGEFDPARDPYASIGPDALDRPEHRQLAREVAREQVVLLKNADDGLPLTITAGLRVAVLGPFAATICQDWYSGTMPYRITVADGLRKAVEAGGGTLISVEGVDRIALRAIGSGAFVSVADGTGRPTLTCGVDVSAAHFDIFDWGEGVSTLRHAPAGRYVTVKNDDTLVADQVQPNGWEVRETFTLLAQDDDTVVLCNIGTGRYVQVAGETGVLTATAKRIEDAERFEKQLVRAGLDDVRALLRKVDAAVVVLGNDPHINGRETQDRTTLALPPAQRALIQAVAGAHPRTVLVVMSSYPYDLSWADAHLPAIVWTSHAGQETGHAVADVLLGEHSPSGRLPQTWYRNDDDLPSLLEYDVIKARRTYQYFDGTPLYPFGHGLTYTTFDYGPAWVARTGDRVTVTLDVTNTGTRDAVEVVQLYTRVTGAAIDRPVRRLQAWQRVALEPGRPRPIELEFPLSGLAHWDVATHEHRIEPGRYQVLVGRSGADVRSEAELLVTGDPIPPRRVVDVTVAAADFDDYAGVTLVDTTRESGDAVEAVTSAETDDPAAGWLLFRAADLSGEPTRLRVRVSRSHADDAELELRADRLDGPVLATVVVPDTGGRYSWLEVTAETTAPDGVHDLYLLLRGVFRLDTFRLESQLQDTINSGTPGPALPDRPRRPAPPPAPDPAGEAWPRSGPRGS